MGSLVIRVLSHAATHALVRRYAANSGRNRTQRGWALFKDPGVPLRSKLAALTIGTAFTWLLILLQVPFEILFGLMIPFFFDEAAMLLVNGLEIVLLPMLIGTLVLPRLVRNQSPVLTAPPMLGETIEMPPPILFQK